MSTSYELLYFPLPGRAEPIRLLFALAQVAYTNTGVTNWPELKPKTPLGQLPVLIERSDSGEKQIAQTATILRHLARVFNLYGADEAHKTQADMISDTAFEWRGKFAPVQFAQIYRTEQSVIDKYWTEAPATLALFDRLLGDNEYYAGKSATFADVLVFETLESHVRLKADCLAELPRLAAFVARVRALPGIGERIAAR